MFCSNSLTKSFSVQFIAKCFFLIIFKTIKADVFNKWMCMVNGCLHKLGHHMISILYLILKTGITDLIKFINKQFNLWRLVFWFTHTDIISLYDCHNCMGRLAWFFWDNININNSMRVLLLLIWELIHLIECLKGK